MQVAPGPRLTSSKKKAVGSRAQRLANTVIRLAGDIGPRNIYHYGALCSAAEFIEKEFARAGYRSVRQTYQAHGRDFHNIVAEHSAPAPEVVVVGAHYDTHKDSPGANDNGSPIAALLELAAMAREWQTQRALRFVAFTNEEAPFTRTEEMGSVVYARACRENRDRIAAMLCLETLGCCRMEIGSQWLSLHGLLLPRSGDFLALVGNQASRLLLAQISRALGASSSVRVRALTLPSQLPGARSSDHWSFWRQGFQAVRATDTAPLRYRYYHTRDDTPDKLDFAWLARVGEGLSVALHSLAVCSSPAASAASPALHRTGP